jgi:hypothetical protein
MLTDTGRKNHHLWKVAILAGAAALALHSYPVLHPLIIYDDFQLLARSRTWATAWSNLWWSANEHIIPLGRLLTAAWIQIAGKATALPQVIALQGPLALVLALILLFFFIRRDLGHPFYGLVAVILFGVTSLYHQAVSWFAASFSILCLDQMLLALLAAQQWERTGRGRWLAACAVNCALAPAWFASGILAGPFCLVYLLWSKRGRSSFRPRGKTSCVPLLIATVPLLGSAAFLALAVPHSASQVLHLPHYDGQTTWEVLDPWSGVVFTCRALVDNLALGALGISGIRCPLLVVACGLVLWVVWLIWWWYRVPGRRLLALGLSLILCTYVLTYSARATWGYDEVNMTTPTWGRYHLIPELGLVLLVCGGLRHWQGVRFQVHSSGEVSERQLRALTYLVLALFFLHLPRGLIGSVLYTSQEADLQRIERVEKLCRIHHISGDAVRAALEPFSLPLCPGDNAWELVRGSDEPRVISIEETRTLLFAPSSTMLPRNR